MNDFDETLPGPFEYDVKRMAASFEIAARNNGFSQADVQAATLASARAYREAMASFAQMGTMDIWYAHLDEDELRAGIRMSFFHPGFPQGLPRFDRSRPDSFGWSSGVCGTGIGYGRADGAGVAAW